MEQKKLKVIVCGTTFGQFYMQAVSKRNDIFEFAGIYAGGSQRSKKCAEDYQVPLYTSLEEIPDDIDIACVIIRSGVLGGKGTALALDLMKRGIHVIQEQPIHYKDLAECFKAAKKYGVYFKTGDLYNHMPEMKKFVAMANELQKHQKILYLQATYCSQLSYPTVDALAHILPNIKPLTLNEVQNNGGPFCVTSGSMGGIPVVFTYNNESDADDPDNYMHVLQNITIGFEGGHLELVDTFGPVTWVSRLHVPTRGYSLGKDKTDTAQPEYLKRTISRVLGDHKTYSWIDMVSDIFADAIAGDLEELREWIFSKPEISRLGQREITISKQWNEVTSHFGFLSLKEHDGPHPIPEEVITSALQEFENKNE